MKKNRQHYSGIGGQAVLEGVMMKNSNMYAVSVRKPDHEIETEVEIEEDRPFGPDPLPSLSRWQLSSGKRASC